MKKRIAVILTGLSLLMLVGCDTAERSKEAAPSGIPPQASAPPEAPTHPQQPPALADIPASTTGAMVQPPGTDPAKLAEHARALSELGYQSEADKLYSHACNWGHAPSCEQIQASSHQKPLLTAPASKSTSIAAKPASPSGASSPATTRAPSSKPDAVATAEPPVIVATAKPAPVPTPASQVKTPPPTPAIAITATPSPSTAPIHQESKQTATVTQQPHSGTATDKPQTIAMQKLSHQAQGLEEIGFAPVAIKLYKDACLAGDGQSCKRLGEIYIKGTEGIERDYAESVRWYERARQLGIAVPTLEKRTVIR